MNTTRPRTARTRRRIAGALRHSYSTQTASWTLYAWPWPQLPAVACRRRVS
jgi:hypothetical protein